jgi:hypothetical protein
MRFRPAYDPTFGCRMSGSAEGFRRAISSRDAKKAPFEQDIHVESSGPDLSFPESIFDRGSLATIGV